MFGRKPRNPVGWAKLAKPNIMILEADVLNVGQRYAFAHFNIIGFRSDTGYPLSSNSHFEILVGFLAYKIAKSGIKSQKIDLYWSFYGI